MTAYTKIMAMVQRSATVIYSCDLSILNMLNLDEFFTTDVMA